MKLHIFNPEHDIAMAINAEIFTAPHASRKLRADMGYLPALWADDGDIVLVDEVNAALEGIRHLKCKVADVLFVTDSDLDSLDIRHIDISVWGWDIALRKRLLNSNVSEDILPSIEQLSFIRDLSNRKWASRNMLPDLVKIDNRLVGTSEYVTDFDSLMEQLAGNKNNVILKAPWSSSGRGLRYVCGEISHHQEGWAHNIIKRQQGIMVEPFYNKVKDFGMEFFCDESGAVTYRGLSLFQTVNGAYVGNYLSSEPEKRRLISEYVDVNLLDSVKDKIIEITSSRLVGQYVGPFGIDMMIVAGNESESGFLLHPCVEMNLRRTMGHVAISISPKATEPQQLMRIELTDKYRLKIQNLNTDLLNTSVL